jgi:hypothetical protein
MLVRYARFFARHFREQVTYLAANPGLVWNFLWQTTHVFSTRILLASLEHAFPQLLVCCLFTQHA